MIVHLGPWTLAHRAHKAYKTKFEATSHVKFCSLRNAFHAAQPRAYQSFLDRTQANLVSDPSKSWLYVNEMRKTSGYPSLMCRWNDRTTDMQRKSDLFAEFFRDVLDDQIFGLSMSVDIGLIMLSESQVLSALDGVRPPRQTIIEKPYSQKNVNGSHVNWIRKLCT